MAETQLDQESRAGSLQAECTDLRLRLQESLERERRLIELLREAEEALADVPRNEHELRQQIENYSAFNRAVERSLPWRVIQALRRLVGRQW